MTRHSPQAVMIASNPARKSRDVNRAARRQRQRARAKYAKADALEFQAPSNTEGGKTARHKDKNLAKRLKKKAHKAVLKAADIAIAQHASGPSQAAEASLHPETDKLWQSNKQREARSGIPMAKRLAAAKAVLTSLQAESPQVIAVKSVHGKGSKHARDEPDRLLQDDGQQAPRKAPKASKQQDGDVTMQNACDTGKELIERMQLLTVVNDSKGLQSPQFVTVKTPAWASGPSETHDHVQDNEEHTPDTQALESQASLSPLTALCMIATEMCAQTALNSSPQPQPFAPAEDMLTPVVQGHNALRLQLGQDPAEDDVRPDDVVAQSPTAFRQPDLHADQAADDTDADADLAADEADGVPASLADADAGADAEVEAAVDSGADASAQAGASTEAVIDAEADAEVDAEVADCAEADAEDDTDADADTDIMSDAEVDLEANDDTVVIPDTEVEADTDVEADSDAGSDADNGPGAASAAAIAAAAAAGTDGEAAGQQDAGNGARLPNGAQQGDVSPEGERRTAAAALQEDRRGAWPPAGPGPDASASEQGSDDDAAGPSSSGAAIGGGVEEDGMDLTDDFEAARVVEQPLRSNFQHLGAFLAEPSTQPLKLTDIAQSTMQTIQDLAFGNNKSDPNETLVYHRCTNVEIMRETILCLKPGGWLTDEIINIYMALLQDRDALVRLQRLGYPTCFFFNSFFVKKLFSDDMEYNFEKVKGQVTPEMLECEKLIFPVHLGVHWMCAEVDRTKQTVTYYDSLWLVNHAAEAEAITAALLCFVADLSEHVKGEQIDTSAWVPSLPMRNGTPRQTTGCDCGVFALLFAEYAARNADFNFAQRHIRYYRVKMVADIATMNIRIPKADPR